MIINPYITFIVSLIMLIYGADKLIENSKHLAYKLNISTVVIGITIVAFGTSLPELVVSIIASFKNQPSIVIGNIIGSNIANVGLVLGICTFIYPIYFNENNRKNLFNFFTLFISTILFIIFLLTGYMNKLTGLFFLLLLSVYIYLLFKNFSMREEVNSSNSDTYYSYYYLIIFIMLGCCLVSIGSDLFINAIIDISSILGYENNLVISMSLVALGTSLPELTTSFIAIKKKEMNLAIGNILGSNIMNILLIGGITSTIGNLILPHINSIVIHLSIMLILTFLLIVSCIFIKKINRILSVIFIGIYIIFIAISSSISS